MCSQSRAVGGGGGGGGDSLGSVAVGCRDVILSKVLHTRQSTFTVVSVTAAERWLYVLKECHGFYLEEDTEQALQRNSQYPTH